MKHPTGNSPSEYLSGDLREEEAYEYERHLLECQDCRQEVALLTHVIAEEPSADELAILDLVDSRKHIQAAKVKHQRTFNGWLKAWAMPTWKLAFISTSMVLLVALTWGVLSKRNLNTISQVASIERPFEGRLSGQQYSEFTHERRGATARKREGGEDQLARLSTSSQELGRFYLEHDDLDKAAVQLENAKRNDATSPDLCNDLGVAYMESGSDESIRKAIREFQQALQLNPHFAPAVFNLALAYERSGNFAEAEQQLRLYLDIDPDSGWAKEVKVKLQFWKH